MSRLFNDADPDYIEVNTAVLAGVPLTLAGWFKSNDAANDGDLISIVDKDVDNHYLRLITNGSAGGDPLLAIARSTPSQGIATTTAGYTVDTWHHAAAVFAAIDDISVFIDGGSKGTNAVSSTPLGLDRTCIGTLGRNPRAGNFSGDIAEVGIWNIALTDAEVARLAAGYSPLLVRPESLVLYMPLVREVHDVVGGIGMVNTGTTVSDHPAILTPTGPQLVPAAAFAPPTVFASQRLKIGHGR